MKRLQSNHTFSSIKPHVFFNQTTPVLTLIISETRAQENLTVCFVFWRLPSLAVDTFDTRRA